MSAVAIPNPIEIVCITCTQVMRVEKQVIEGNTSSVILALECACGRRVGTLECIRRSALGQRWSSDRLQPIEDLGTYGRDLTERARELMQRAEDYIGMATWAQDGKR